jgi:hypothetical protein
VLTKNIEQMEAMIQSATEFSDTTHCADIYVDRITSGDITGFKSERAVLYLEFN